MTDDGVVASTRKGRWVDARSKLVRLTHTERRILDFLARGLDNRRIAAELHVTEKTVKAHITNILRKLDVASRLQAALALREEELLVSHRSDTDER